jgi:hypothetical protein
MELAQILRELGRHRVWLGVAVLVAVVAAILQAYPPRFDPIGLEKKTLEVGAASADVVIDSRTSTLIDITGDVEPLVQRAQTYARLGGSRPVREIIGRKVGIPGGVIAVDASGEVEGEERADQLNFENAGYRLNFDALATQPFISIAAQGPTAEGAVKLANGAAEALDEYVTRQQDQQKVPPWRRVKVRQIGTAQGGVINNGVDLVASALTGLAAFVAFCLLILFVSRTRSDLQRVRASEEAPTWTDSSEATGAHPLHSSDGASVWEPFEPREPSATPVSDEAERVARRG